MESRDGAAVLLREQQERIRGFCPEGLRSRNHLEERDAPRASKTGDHVEATTTVWDSGLRARALIGSESATGCTFKPDQEHGMTGSSRALDAQLIEPRETIQ